MEILDTLNTDHIEGKLSVNESTYTKDIVFQNSKGPSSRSDGFSTWSINEVRSWNRFKMSLNQDKDFLPPLQAGPLGGDKGGQMLRCLVKGAGATEAAGAAPSGALVMGGSTGAARG